MARRIGFLLANVYQGSSTSMWKAMAEAAASDEESALFVFPGGRLRYAPGNEYLRNGIYDLANGSSLDGAVIWASALSGSVGADEAASFAREKAGEMKVVSLGMLVDGCPSVDFDAYSGMLAEVGHMISVHGDRRIAFIRGPESHRSAEDRLRAYRDALQGAGIAYDERLVSSPYPWAEGDAAVKELIECRGLVPGRDFTALVAASDMLLLSAFRYLESAGIRIPRMLHVAGFNDNDENALMSVSTTTVRLPIARLAVSSYGLISSLCDGGSSPDILLSTDLIVRHSCGCSGLFGTEGRSFSVDDDELWRIIGHRFDNPGSEAALRRILSYLLGEGDDLALFSSCEDFIASGGDPDVLFEVVPVLSGQVSEERKGRLFLRIVFEERRARTKERQRVRSLSVFLDRFKTRLLAAKAYDELPAIMQETFAGLGIGKCFLMLYADFSETLFVGGFSGDAIYAGGERFPRRLIAPSSLSAEVERGIFVIEPLFYDSQEQGYIVVGARWCEGYVLEDIRTSLSSALKGISFFEEAREAKERAEQGERNAEEFYARLSEGVMQPLSQMRSSLMRKGRLPRAGLLHSILGAEHLLELALAERGELSVSLSLQPLSLLVSSLVDEGLSVQAPPRLPLMEIDRDRLSEAMLIICSSPSGINGRIAVLLSERGVIFSIKEGPVELEETALKLVEMIVVVHSGSMERREGDVSILIPYPRLADGSVKGEGIVFIKGGEDAMPEGLDARIVDKDDLSSCSPRALALLDTNRQGAAALLSSRSLCSVPVILFSEREEFSLRATLESIASSKERLVLLLGPSASIPPSIEDIGRILTAGSLDDAVSLKEQVSLIVFSYVDEDAVARIRSSQRLSSIPVLIVRERFSERDIERIASIPNVMIANPSILESKDFLSRLVAIADGSGMLPPFTGLIVKRAIAYLNDHATQPISRWQLAEAVSISEDYLARIFRKELGLSPWDYLNRYRIQLSVSLLLGSGRTLSEIARDSGFQDQAYFCRVFKKIKGFSPGHVRQRK